MTSIAENIANANTPNYRPLRVTFEAALRDAARQGIGPIEEVQPKLTRESGMAAGDGVRIDMELAASTATRERYSALAELLGRELLITSVVTTGGRS